MFENAVFGEKVRGGLDGVSPALGQCVARLQCMYQRFQTENY